MTLISKFYSAGIFDKNQKPVQELLLSEPELSRVGRYICISSCVFLGLVTFDCDEYLNVHARMQDSEESFDYISCCKMCIRIPGLKT